MVSEAPPGWNGASATRRQAGCRGAPEAGAPPLWHGHTGTFAGTEVSPDEPSGETQGPAALALSTAPPPSESTGGYRGASRTSRQVSHAASTQPLGAHSMPARSWVPVSKCCPGRGTRPVREAVPARRMPTACLVLTRQGQPPHTDADEGQGLSLPAAAGAAPGLPGRPSAWPARLALCAHPSPRPGPGEAPRALTVFQRLLCLRPAVPALPASVCSLEQAPRPAPGGAKAAQVLRV